LSGNTTTWSDKIEREKWLVAISYKCAVRERERIVIYETFIMTRTKRLLSSSPPIDWWSRPSLIAKSWTQALWNLRRGRWKRISFQRIGFFFVLLRNQNGEKREKVIIWR